MLLRLILLLMCLTVSVSAAPRVERWLKQPDGWFSSEEGRQAMESILSWQSEHGDWPKNRDTSSGAFDGDRSKLQGTFDNGATTAELRVLARAFSATGEEAYAEAISKGIDHILDAQYPNGGFPQYFPLRKGYYSRITFNDGSMVRLLEFLRDAYREERFAFLDEKQREAAQRAFQMGILCILKCQVKVDGKLTVWCAQHDEESLEPANARSYELASLSGGESGGILIFLMSLEDPSSEVEKAIEAGVAWYERSKIEGYRYRKSENEPALVKDSEASPLWARFYEIETNRPFFCDRDGVKKYDIMEIGSERRRGYSWYTGTGAKVARAYAEWKDQR